MKFKSSEGGKNYLRLKSGESVQGVFRGDPHEFKQHYVKAENRSYECPAPAECVHCKAGLKPGFRFKINFLVNENGAYVAKTWEAGWQVYEGLRALHESDYNLEKHIMKIARHGSGTDTTYAIVPKPNGQVDAALEAKLAQVAMNDLTLTQKVDAQAPALTDEDVPF